MSVLLEAADEYAALELLHELGCTDGLPVVVPTPARVERMALASGLASDLSLGAMGPNLGDATVEKIAACAVMAGCLPDHMPVVMAAVSAVLDPAFDLTELQATTHCLAPLIVVNGPARRAAGLAGGFGALGAGHRANAAIGRALRLCMINIGGGRPGVSDMSLHGHPGKFSFCLGEAEEDSPFPPLHEARGFASGESAVTVVGVEAPHSVLGLVDADDAGSAERFLRTLGACLANVGSNNIHLRGGAAVVVLNPDHAAGLAAAGYDRASLTNALHGFASRTVGELAPYATAFRHKGPADKVVHAFRRPEDILVLVAGGVGLYSMVMPSWCGGPHRNPAISKPIELDQACEIPGLAPAGAVNA
ncbi:MAG: hypothetical protein ACKVWR_14720 [Acidimicrobiales bacterium]